VNNTDAEGRLTLADALLYCQQQGVTEATIGACWGRPELPETQKKRPKPWLPWLMLKRGTWIYNGFVISVEIYTYFKVSNKNERL